MMDYTILIAEDDPDIVRLLKLYLESSNYCVFTANDGQSAYEIIKREKIDLAILDIMMPKMDGYELTRQIREIKNIPLIIVSAKNDDEDKILGLNLGADDYITKPFNPLEVVARVSANLRRFYSLNEKIEPSVPSQVLQIGELCLDVDKMSLMKREEEIPLTPNEYKIMALLMEHPGRVYTKSQICVAVNGESYENYENAIAVHISHLRDKIEDDPHAPQYIRNIRGIGYKIEKP
jgi:DNA-binding response OmpR family regulator